MSTISPSKKFVRLRVLTPKPEDLARTPIYLSRNSKTGTSINVSIAETCRPTPACAAYCYGLTGRMVMSAALQRQVQNAQVFAHASRAQLDREAEDVVHAVSREQNFLRVFGVGDLQPGSVYFINKLSAYAERVRPEFSVWVATRKFDLAERLEVRKNLHVMLGFDSATPEKWLRQGQALLEARRPQFFAAWVRQRAEDVAPAWADVVFEEHRAGGARANRRPHPRACPATIHANYPRSKAHDGACAACRFCFDVNRRKKGRP